MNVSFEQIARNCLCGWLLLSPSSSCFVVVLSDANRFGHTFLSTIFTHHT